MSDAGRKMTRDWNALREFERDLIRRESADPVKNLKMVDAMYEEAKQLGVFPLSDPLEGLETKLRIARAINLVREDPLENS